MDITKEIAHKTFQYSCKPYRYTVLDSLVISARPTNTLCKTLRYSPQDPSVSSARLFGKPRFFSTNKTKAQVSNFPTLFTKWNSTVSSPLCWYVPQFKCLISNYNMWKLINTVQFNLAIMQWNNFLYKETEQRLLWLEQFYTVFIFIQYKMYKSKFSLSK